MTEVIELRENGVYFTAAFFDTEFTIPHVASYVYVGYDEEDGHLFQDSESFAQMAAGEAAEKGHYLRFDAGKVHGILDRACFIKWLQDEHGPFTTAPTYEYRII